MAHRFLGSWGNKLGKTKFSFEDLEVWQYAIEFAKRVIDLSGQISTDKKHYRLIEQLEAASTSVAMNIAEGKGRYSKKEFVQYLFIAKGSLFETITLLRIFHRMNWLSDAQIDEVEDRAVRISKMLSSLIKYVRDSIKK